MSDRRADPDARERLDVIQQGYLRFSRVTKRILMVLVIAQIGLGVLSVNLVDQNNKRSDENRRLISKIQDERRYSVRLQCSDVNQRHDATFEELARLTPPDAPKENIRATQVLIDRLLPVRDCDDLVLRLVGGEGAQP